MSPAAAPCLDAVADHERRVHGHVDAARTRMNARDGKGCVAELDAYDQSDPWTGGPSTSAASPLAMMRGMCLMLGAECGPGKELYRAALVNSAGATLGPEMLDKSVDAVASMYCQGGALTPRDELLRALMDLNQGAYMSKKDPGWCKAAYDTATRLVPVVPPRDEDDTQVKQAATILRVTGPACMARAGDCQAAWAEFRECWLKEKVYDDAILHKMFDGMNRRCSDP